MPICITGMHRSGTSLVAQLLNVCGVDLGPEEEFFPGNEFNADGYWENTRFSELGDAVLEALGGGWDSPPEPPEDWSAVAGLAPIRAAALDAVDDLGLAEPWGWKDPRASLAVPFWVDLLPDLRVVVCVRHPLEVARSLHRRGASSPQLGLALWHTYNEHLLATTDPKRRVVTHYAAYLADPRAELRRVARTLGLRIPAKVLGEAASRVKGELRHYEAGAADPPLAEDVLVLYDELCAEARIEPETRRKTARRPRSAAPLSYELAADAWRAHMDSLRGNRDEWREAAESAQAELAELRVTLEELAEQRDDLQAQAAEMDKSRATWEHEAAQQTAAHEHWEGEASRLSGLVEELTARAGGLETELAELQRATEELETQRADLERRAVALEQESGGLRGERDEQIERLTRLREERAGLGEQLDELGRERDALREDGVRLRIEFDRVHAERETLQAEQAGLRAQHTDLQGQHGVLQEQHDELQARHAEVEIRHADAQSRHAELAGEHSDLLARHEELQLQHAALEGRHAEVVARAAALGAERSALAVTGDRLRKQLYDAEAETEQLRRESERVRGAQEVLAAELARRGRDLAEAERERAAYAEDRDRWREQARLLLDDRDRWQEQAAEQARQAAAWREEAQRRRVGPSLRRSGSWLAHALLWLPALLWSWLRRARLPQRGWWPRLRLKTWRKAFPQLQRVWWALPRGLRDFLRPIIFRDGRARPAVRAYAPPQLGPMLSARAAGTGVSSEIPRHRQAELPQVAAGAALPSISVLIPTLNGGPDFERTLAGILRQEGIGELELVVVDSGSTDGTAEAARRAGANVIEIPQSEFGHGRTRNLAAEAASGDVLLMLVQDAIPLTPHVFRNLLAYLIDDPRAAAAWARQVPRSDSDLYGAFVVYAHDRVTVAERARALKKAPDRRTPEERRALAGLDDVCAALRREAWNELRFGDVGFAEDLDFGLRAVDAGWTIRHAPSAAVAHSHTRDAAYHLRRAVADRLFVAERLGDDRLSRAAGAGPASVAAASVTLAAELEGAVRRVPIHLEPDATLDSWIDALGRMLERKPPRMEPSGQLAILSEAVRAANGQVTLDPPVDELRQELLALLAWPPLLEFGLAQLTPDPVAVAGLVAKLAASALGRALGDALRLSGDESRARELMAGI